MGMTAAIMTVGVFLPMSPFADYFKFQALPFGYFPWLGVILFGYMALAQGMKSYYRRRFVWQ
jgi:Mg2+-importing ATPase